MGRKWGQAKNIDKITSIEKETLNIKYFVNILSLTPFAAFERGKPSIHTKKKILLQKQLPFKKIMPTLLELSRELAALAQAGLTYSKDPFDQERFHRIRGIAGELLQTNDHYADFKWPQEVGYPTPKIDVRGVIFQNDHVLLVKERASKQWTLPGGWADVNQTLCENVERECLEETGYKVKATSIASIVDMERAHYPKSAHSIYKIFLLCKLIGGIPTANIEISDIAFYPIDQLPELDPFRANKEGILQAYEHFLNPHVPTYFN
ncbi:MAG: NUDIX hydrolase [Chthoniobacterales bacterium]